MFRSPRDYEVFISITREALLKYRLDIHAYALMPNHVHFLTTAVASDSIALVMQAMGRRYVPYFNRRYQRTGGLFEGRYRSFVVDDERYWMTCMRYIELNPVRAGLVVTPDAYQWTSYCAHAMGAPDPLVTDHPLYLRLAHTPGERFRSWQSFCAQGIPETELSKFRRQEGSERGQTRD
jgi:putative transposase